MQSICERTTCIVTQSSVRNGLSAEKVIDGITDQKEGNCSHTAEGQSVAWVMVDLGRQYKIKNITIYYRFEGSRENDWKPYRFRKYRLEVSNSSGPTQSWIECYKDNTPDTLTPESIQYVPCEETARYIRIITTYDAPEDDKIRISGAILEICEIKIYGVVTCSPHCVDMQCDGNGTCTRGCNQGYWGGTCEKKCPSTCPMNVCNINTGFCDSCSNGHYGDTCEKICSSTCLERKCIKQTGICSSGCVPGYYGYFYSDCTLACGNCSTSTCDRNTGNCQTCNTGYYGAKCDIHCRNACFNKECSQNNGSCSNGCNSGLYGLFCDKLCNKNCRQFNCSQNGTCINGCKPNWSGDTCNRCDSTHFGTNCSQVCNVNCINQACNNVTGVCTVGCKSGFYSQKCEQRCSASCQSNCNRNSGSCEGECPAGKYGDRCEQTCHQNCKKVCSKSSGLCTSGCIDGKFGADCLQTCSGGCISGCNQDDGSCTCKIGWKGRYCD
ncbi:multiple epidermal growth factor-like domains protein 10, partial [Saccostrea cucullata]|uniref:multiple epidermal growth factor-like domains protein 10 n=1 Tax=Saccostrea cuccullata TaxID=36930 RepID=UPI002ED1DE00